MTIDAVLDRIDTDLDASLDRLLTFLRIPSISTDPDYLAETRQAAEWLRDELAGLGCEAQIHDTPGHPMVTATTGGKGRPILFYGHYDVQPVDPLELWTRDPFEPTIEDVDGTRVIRGRGAADDKGQLYMHVKALEAHLATSGSLPVNVVVLAEGEAAARGAVARHVAEASCARTRTSWSLASGTSTRSGSAWHFTTRSAPRLSSARRGCCRAGARTTSCHRSTAWPRRRSTSR